MEKVNNLYGNSHYSTVQNVSICYAVRGNLQITSNKKINIVHTAQEFGLGTVLH